MSEVRITAIFESDNPERLKRIAKSHMDWLVDFDTNRDVITSVHGVQSYEIQNTPVKEKPMDKIRVLTAILRDIIGDSEPGDEVLDDEWAELFAELHNMDEALKKCGFVGWD